MDNSLKRRILHIFFPNRCPVCKKVIYPNDSFCSECEAELTPFSGCFTVNGAKSFTAVYEYDEKISPAIFLLKNGICGNAAYAMGKALAEKLRNEGISEGTDLIIPVPMYKKDQLNRGFNQSELICREVGRILGIPVSSRCLTKSKSTANQKTLGKEERSKNLKGVFSITCPQDITDKNILIIDDVCTTGSTLAEITGILMKAGAQSVSCAACCKTPQKVKHSSEM